MTAAAVLNLVATVCLMRSAVYSASQKALQMALVWVIPLVGAIFVLSVRAHDRKSASRDPVVTVNDRGYLVLVRRTSIVTMATVWETAAATMGMAEMGVVRANERPQTSDTTVWFSIAVVHHRPQRVVTVGCPGPPNFEVLNTPI
jgi:hypothetical protein